MEHMIVIKSSVFVDSYVDRRNRVAYVHMHWCFLLLLEELLNMSAASPVVLCATVHVVLVKFSKGLLCYGAIDIR